MKVLITGATGFLGYHITKACLTKGYEVACLKRSTSKSLFESDIEKHIQWLTEGDLKFAEELQAFSPDVLVHAAWGGVAADGRHNPAVQAANVEMTRKMMNVFPFRQVIMLGSQDEYGRIDRKIDENFPLHPVSEYAKAKIECLGMLQKHAEETDVEWQWIRIFSAYGEKQQENWLIPSVIHECMSGAKVMETTPGEQVYSYLYAEDFARAIASMIGTKGKSGVYNISSSTAIQLKELFQLIKELTGADITFRPSLPYRPNQSMMILGDASKFIRAFGSYEQTSLKEGIRNMINNQ
jgi:UDP-glucose 4-epimerase